LVLFVFSPQVSAFFTTYCSTFGDPCSVFFFAAASIGFGRRRTFPALSTTFRFWPRRAMRLTGWQTKTRRQLLCAPFDLNDLN